MDDGLMEMGTVGSKNRGDKSFATYLGPLLLLTSIFFINFIARIIQAPLLPDIEKDLGLTHTAAASLFLSISSGYFVTLIGSGFISCRLQHRGTIILSIVALGAALFGTALSRGVFGIRIGLFGLGLAAGLYLPSGIATLTELISTKHWGKAIAVHELAPNISFMTAPLIAEAMLLRFSWRGVLWLLGVTAFFLGFIVWRYGRGGRFAGEPPSPDAIRDLMSEPSFWIMVLLFTLGVSGTLGIFTMLPIYLVTEHGLERDWANTLIALSRISGLIMAFVGGWTTDRFGAKKTLGIVLLVTGILTVLLGGLPSRWVPVIVFIQPMSAVCFFPAAFAALASVGPPKARNIVVSFSVPIAFLLGGGGVPTAIGAIGDNHSFGLGICLTGCFILAGAFLTCFLKFSDKDGPTGSQHP
jgi:NNP family nitrate/nitrite transporter-like MFS transporter